MVVYMPFKSESEEDIVLFQRGNTNNMRSKCEWKWSWCIGISMILVVIVGFLGLGLIVHHHHRLEKAPDVSKAKIVCFMCQDFKKKAEHVAPFEADCGAKPVNVIECGIGEVCGISFVKMGNRSQNQRGCVNSVKLGCVEKTKPN